MNLDINDFLNGSIIEKEINENIKEKICTYFDCNFSIPVSTGTVAIEIVLRALDIPRGKVVIVPDISFIATATAVANCGLLPVYADIDEDYFGLTLKSLKEKYNDSVKAVILVHLGGYVNRDIFNIKEFCKQKNIYLIEDCAQAFPCTINNIHVGTIGDAGTFSFQSSKIISSGEGGLILTNSLDIATKCDAIASWGLSPGYSKRNLEIASSNFRLSSIQKYLILKQLEDIHNIISRRLKIVEKLKKLCIDNGINVLMPKNIAEVFDCPFFFPIESKIKLNTIEPREESPMRNSTIVKSILKKFFPDLLNDYNILNQNNSREFISDRVIKNIDFINIKQCPEDSFVKLITDYKAHLI